MACIVDIAAKRAICVALNGLENGGAATPGGPKSALLNGSKTTTTAVRMDTASNRRSVLQTLVSPRYRWLTVLGVVVVVATCWYFITRRQESLKEAAESLRAAFLSHDARTMYRYVRDDEREIGKLDYPKFEMFVGQFVAPKFQGFSPVGEPKYELSESQGLMMVTQNMSHPDGRVVPLGLVVVETEDGPKCSGLVYYLFMDTLWTEYAHPPPLPSGLVKLQFRAKAIDSNLSMLKNTGLDGMAAPTGRASTLKYYTWEQFRDEQLEKFRTHQPSRSGTSR
jgi:hypothetical protein